jgi:hypothetical protein
MLVVRVHDRHTRGPLVPGGALVGTTSHDTICTLNAIASDVSIVAQRTEDARRCLAYPLQHIGDAVVDTAST